MKLETSFQTIYNLLPLATQTNVAEGTETTQASISGELGIIALGVILLGIGSFMFLVKLCKSLASSANK